MLSKVLFLDLKSLSFTVRMTVCLLLAISISYFNSNNCNLRHHGTFNETISPKVTGIIFVCNPRGKLIMRPRNDRNLFLTYICGQRVSFIFSIHTWEERDRSLLFFFFSIRQKIYSCTYCLTREPVMSNIVKKM